MSFSVLLNPPDSEIYKLPLAHQTECGMTKFYLSDNMGLFEGITNLSEVLAINIEGVVGFPHTLTVFHHGTMLRQEVLAGVIGTGICQME